MEESRKPNRCRGLKAKRSSARGSHIQQVVDGKDGRNQQRHKTDPCVIVYYALPNDHNMGITFSLIG